MAYISFHRAYNTIPYLKDDHASANGEVPHLTIAHQPSRQAHSMTTGIQGGVASLFLCKGIHYWGLCILYGIA